MRLGTALVLIWALVTPEAQSSISLSALKGLFDTALSVTGFGSSQVGGSQVMRRFDEIAAAISQVESEVGSVSRALGPLWNFDLAVGRQISWGNTVQTLEQLLQNVNSKYDRFLLYKQSNSSIETWTLEDFARETISHGSDSAVSTMYSLRDLVQRDSLRSPAHQHRNRRRRRFTLKPGLFQQLQSMLQGSKTMVCGLEQSPQQFAHGLTVILLTALYKIRSMVLFSYMLLRAHGKGTFTTEEDNFTASFLAIVDAVAERGGAVARRLPAAYWRCDPALHVRGATFEEVTELLQGCLENEKDMSSTCSCEGTCSDYKTARADRCYSSSWYKKDWQRLALECQHQRHCAGTLHDCRFRDSVATVCQSNRPHRRYSWIQWRDELQRKSVVFGKQDADICPTTCRRLSWVAAFIYHCSLCFCLCDDDTQSERYFSLLPAVADIDKIVTGVKFVKQNRVFYIQLRQDDADRAGLMKNSTEQWKDIEIDRYINISSNREGDHYLRFSYERRSVLLQDLGAPPGHVVTGVAFDSVGDHLSLKIRATAISAAGGLLGNSSVWVRANTTVPATRLELGSDPELSMEPSWPDSSPGQTVRFEPSSAELDAAQTTLPYLDVQPVAPWPPSALAGVGLYHKGRPGFAGFLGLHVFPALPSE